MAAILSNGLVRNLRLIRDRMRELEPGVEQTPIQYDRSDAIGELVDEYNALLEQLQAAIQELAKQEREGAWRMMAMQVAHEIKILLHPSSSSALNNWSAPGWIKKKTSMRHCDATRGLWSKLTSSRFLRISPCLAAVGLDTAGRGEFDTGDQRGCGAISAIKPPNRMAHVHSRYPRFLEGPRHTTRAMNNLIANAIDAVAMSPIRRLHSVWR